MPDIGRLKKTAIACALIGAVALFGLVNQRRAAATPGVPDNEDSRLIQETIYRSYELQKQVVLTSDTSVFRTVFVNDARGGELSLAQIQRLQEATNQHSKTDFGYLDWQVDFFTLRLAPTPAQPSLESDVDGPVARPTAPGVLVLSSGAINLRFISIVIEGDRAVAIFDDGARTCEMVLVKLDGKWLIAGRKILRAYP
jgi:hypothetical protein